MSGKNATLVEVPNALAELAVTRGMRFDKQDLKIWMERLQDHDHSGLTLEAARRFGELDALQSVPLTLASFLQVVRQIRAERIKAMEDVFLPPPSGIDDEQYKTWLKIRNEGAVRQMSPEQIDAHARTILGLPSRPSVSARAPHVLYLEGPAS